MVKDREAWGAAVHVVAESRTRLSNWTTTNVYTVNLVRSVLPSLYSSPTRARKAASTSKKKKKKLLLGQPTTPTS